LLDVGARGIFHFSNEGETTFYDYAAFLLAHAGMGRARLSAISSQDLSREAYPATRPAYAVLSKDKYRKATGVFPRRWEDAVTDFLRNRERERAAE
jgi:dTDP-4-dehydrorhamnose reductase